MIIAERRTIEHCEKDWIVPEEKISPADNSVVECSKDFHHIICDICKKCIQCGKEKSQYKSNNFTVLKTQTQEKDQMLYDDKLTTICSRRYWQKLGPTEKVCCVVLPAMLVIAGIVGVSVFLATRN